MDPESHVPIFSTTDSMKAEFLRAELQDEGIDCEVEGGHQGGLAGVLQVRLLVRAKDADRAREFLEKHDEA